MEPGKWKVILKKCPITDLKTAVIKLNKLSNLTPRKLANIPWYHHVPDQITKSQRSNDIASSKSKTSKSGIKKLHGYEKDLKTPVIKLWKLSTQTPLKMNQVPYHLLTSAERKSPAITKSKIDRTFELEKLRQEHVVNLVELKKKDAASAAKMKLKPIMVSLKKKVKNHVTKVKKTLPKIEAEFKEYLPHDWIKEVYRRKKGGKYDTYIIHIPSGKRFRSNVEIDKFLSKNPDIACDRDLTSCGGAAPKKAGKPAGKGRGKPAKKDESSADEEDDDDDDIQEVAVVPKLAAKKVVAKNGAGAAGNGKGRGRPPKKRALDDEGEDTNGAPAAKKGKPKAKAKPESEEDEEDDDDSEAGNGKEDHDEDDDDEDDDQE